MQGTVKNESGEPEIFNAEAEALEETDLNDPRFEQQKF